MNARRRFWVCFAVTIVAVGLALVVVRDIAMLGGDPVVRLDSGDPAREILWGTLRMSEGRRREPDRSLLIAAAKEISVPARWCSITRRAPTNTDGGRNHLYTGIAFWLEHEPRLGKRIFADIVEYLRNQSRSEGLPPSASLVFGIQWDEGTRKHRLGHVWMGGAAEGDEFGRGMLQRTLEEMNYSPETGGLIERILAGETR